MATVKSPLKMMKKAFDFTLKVLFLLKIFKFLSLLFDHVIIKIRFISKLITSQPGEQAIPIHILPDISRRKGNQTKKFIQLIEYNITNIFLDKR